jgi:hypothetical protein
MCLAHVLSPITLLSNLKYHKSTNAPIHDAWFWKTIDAIFLTFKIVELGHILTTMDIQSMQNILTYNNKNELFPHHYLQVHN